MSNKIGNRLTRLLVCQKYDSPNLALPDGGVNALSGLQITPYGSRSFASLRRQTALVIKRFDLNFNLFAGKDFIPPARVILRLSALPPPQEKHKRGKRSGHKT
ncbi:hypothetical protein KCP78_16535 [Salmonella enterica subsp. enterica]|nr:hypothetical protein KCP78_16535 [Salmonella enterica subsp. enterica]